MLTACVYNMLYQFVLLALSLFKIKVPFTCSCYTSIWLYLFIFIMLFNLVSSVTTYYLKNLVILPAV